MLCGLALSRTFACTDVNYALKVASRETYEVFVMCVTLPHHLSLLGSGVLFSILGNPVTAGGASSMDIFVRTALLSIAVE